MKLELIEKRIFEIGHCPVCDNPYSICSDEKTNNIVSTTMGIKDGNLVCRRCDSVFKIINEK